MLVANAPTTALPLQDNNVAFIHRKRNITEYGLLVSKNAVQVVNLKERGRSHPQTRVVSQANSQFDHFEAEIYNQLLRVIQEKSWIVSFYMIGEMYYLI